MPNPSAADNTARKQNISVLKSIVVNDYCFKHFAIYLTQCVVGNRDLRTIETLSVTTSL